jgi:3-ketosteroid 9alpha-monooxygenase subunit B
VTHRDHGFHPVRVARVVTETADASSLVLDVPSDQREAYRYDAGQFCTFRVVVDGTPLLRCYSMSSAPAIDDELTVTIKRVPGGAVSNWLLDHVSAGDEVEVTYPAGVFRLDPDETELVAFAAGSGITPVFSLLKTALSTTERHVRLLYANRDPESVIFRREIDALVEQHGDRFDVAHHLDVERGFVNGEVVGSFLGTVDGGAGYYLCGPPPFMDVVEDALLGIGVSPERIHVERFTPAETTDALDAVPAADDVTDAVVTTVTIDLDGRCETADHRPGTTILQTARQLGMAPPFSCESGSCATCMARLVEGSASMHVNDALTADEVDEGWVLTCQAVPSSPSVHVIYGFEGA